MFLITPASRLVRVFAFGLCLLCACRDSGRSGLTRALCGRGTVAVLAGSELLEMHVDGTTLVDVARMPGVLGVLRARADAPLPSALVGAHLDGVLVEGNAARALAGAQDSVARHLASYASLPGLQGLYLSPLAALYVLDPTREWTPALRQGMAEVARRLIAGAEPPRMSSFPDVLRRIAPVEVMVLLRSGKHARLWRSARGTSFARALVTACDVARKRWLEREQAMGGPLDKSLPRLDVEVSLLSDDGEIGVHEKAFIDRVVGPTHGVGYEHKGAWRYLLPEDTHKPGSGKPSDAYLRLLAEEGLPASALSGAELRLYRMAVHTVGVSPAPAPAGVQATPVQDEISPVHAPSEILGR